jgi:hypothetical protein
MNVRRDATTNDPTWTRIDPHQPSRPSNHWKWGKHVEDKLELVPKKVQTLCQMILHGLVNMDWSI